MSNGVSNARFLAINQVVRIVSQLAAFLVYARLMSPSDYGVAVLVFTVVNLANLLRDLGTSASVIQRETLTSEFLQGAFRLCLFMGIGISLTLLLCSGLLASFMGEPRLSVLLKCSSITFLIGCFGYIPQALVERRSDFATVSKIESIGVLSGLGAGFSCAYFGLGPVSIVIQQITNTLIIVVMYWRFEKWRPALSNNCSYDGLARFSGFLLLFNLVNYFGRNLDSIIIGRVLGTALLGAYNVAYRLMLFPVQNLTSIVSRMLFPVFSRTTSSPEERKSIFLQSVELIACTTAPLMCLLAIVGDHGVLLLFGPKWNAASELLVWLAPVGFIQSIVSVTGALYMGTNRTGTMFCLGTLSTLLYAAAFFIYAPQGLVPAAQAYLIANILNALVSLSVALHTIMTNWWLLIKAIAPSLFCSIAVIIPCIISRTLHPDYNIFIFLLTVATTIPLYFAALRFASPKVYSKLMHFMYLRRRA